MLVDINLLPEKERKNVAAYLIILIVVLISLICSITFYFQYTNGQKQLVDIENELKLIQGLRRVEEEKLAKVTSSNAAEELQAVVDWVEKFPISTVFLLDHLTGLLPERGFIMNLSYSDDGTIGLNVQFDTNRQAAYYLKELNDSPYIQTVNLTSLSTVEPPREEHNNEIFYRDNQYVPRYIGDYQLTLNRDKLKEALHEEGGA